MIKLPRPYLAFDSVLCEALQHNLSGLVPPPHHPSTLYPLPTVVFRMFDYTDCPEGPILPGQHSIERWLIEEQLNHILMSGFKERKEVAAQLLSYPLKNKIPLEYIIVKVMFGQIFGLPNPLCLWRLLATPHTTRGFCCKSPRTPNPRLRLTRTQPSLLAPPTARPRKRVVGL